MSPPVPRSHPKPNHESDYAEIVWRGIVTPKKDQASVELTHIQSDVLKRMLGYGAKEAMVRPQFLSWLAADEAAAAALNSHFLSLEREQIATLAEYPVVSKTGLPVTLEVRTQRLRQLGAGRFEALGTLIQKITVSTETAADGQSGSANAEDTIRHLAFHDTLTDLPNRVLLSDRLASTLQETADTAEETAILFIDLDGFKTVNDTLGHQAGDELLVHVANRLRRSVRDEDLVARFGGDEFVVVLKHIVGGDPERIAETILKSLEESVEVVGRQVFVGASIGVAVSPRDGTTPEDLLRNADNALYRAKDAGRGIVQVYTPTMHLMSSARLLMEEGLRRAIERNEFFLQYQPIWDVATDTMVGAEALLRWRHPLQDVVLPQEFIPIAEEGGIIEDIGRWIVCTVTEHYNSWQAAGITPPPICLNVSGRELRQKNFVPELLEVLKVAKVPTSAFQLEIRENAAMGEAELLLPKLEQLKRAGFTLTLDNFGTGYSSLTRLKQSIFSTIKVDQVFIREASGSASDQAVLQAIINLGHTLGMVVSVSGVETAAQRKLLLSSGCDTLQGYIVSYPLSEKDFAALLTKER